MVTTVPADDSVDEFLASIVDQRRRTDAQAAVQLMREVTGAEPAMWGTMIGFGRQPYTNADGKSHETFAVGVAARKQALTLYGLTYYGSNQDLLDRLGAHTVGKGCLYIKRLDAVDVDVLRELVARGWATNHTP
ncbi:DUF1801 domain-containing protein [Gordonia hydrophobica]|uniref:DUF1801 domain-containing protein n=1 Tax=Gordonia hydrophobica TaxID=40516 RepID=A0ABZ2U0V1_9ACTN|nr:DUF1801 domain-containing protein [Gordonia hydrophobica]MBM7367161.1 hypothetical protein [Gordonia hydrophobica]